MKIVEIQGSPRRNGNTEFILEMCERESKKREEFSNPIDFERIPIYDENISWCKGCRICFTISEKKCPNKDGLLLIKQKMEEADGIIIGSPVYVEDVSAGVKNWIDRLAYHCHRPFLMGKPVYVYTTSASKASKHAVKTMKRAISAWGGNVIQSDNFILGGLRREKYDSKYEIVITKAMHDMFDNIYKQKVRLFSLICFGIQKHYWYKKRPSIDYDYWMEKKWFEPDCFYYKMVEAGRMKRVVVNIVSRLIAAFL